MLKILQAMLQQYMNQELSDVQARFRKGRGIREQIASIHWIIEKAREFQKKKKKVCLWLVDHNKLWNILKEMGIPGHITCSLLQDKKLQSELDMEQRTGWKLGKEYVKAVYCNPVYLTYI